MKKSLLTLLWLFAVGLAVTGAPFRNMPTYFTQPDGSQYHCFASGDEYYPYLHDANGFTIIQSTQNGWFYYATNNDNGELSPSEYIPGQVDPALVGLKPNAHISKAAYNARRQLYSVPNNLKTSVKGTHSGTLNNIVVYIKFKDDTDFLKTRSYYDGLFNSDNSKSLYSYYKEVSYEQLEIIAHQYPECESTTNIGYTDIYNRNYYEPYNATTNPTGYTDNQQAQREHSLIKRAIESVKTAVESQFTADELDINGDGVIDNICFIVRGNNGDWNDLLWAHSWVLYTYNVTINGKRVVQYTWQPETQADVYTFCHEMYHALGAPDLYHYSYDNMTNVGPWDLMESGFVHMGAWMKYKYTDQTWVKTMPEITKAGTYTLKPLASPDSNCYKIKSAYSENEFYVVEYRNATGMYESNCPGSGLIVYRIDSTLGGNADGPPNEVYIYRPGGTNSVDGNINLAHFSSQEDRTEINDNTNPSGFLSDGTLGGLTISNIGEALETISFNVSFDRVDQVNEFFSQVSTSTSVGLFWEPNENKDSVIIAYATSEVSSNPKSGIDYQVGDQLENGESVIFIGNDVQQFGHMNLEPGITYYYKIWSINQNRYSAGTKTSATTYCDATYSIPYTQEFKYEKLPTCWNTFDALHHNQIWEFTNIGSVDFNSFTEANGIACINSAYYGLNQTQSTELISPIFDFTNNSFVYLQFKHYLKVDLNRTQARFMYSTDSSKTWNTIQEWTSSTVNGELFEKDLSSLLAGKANVRFKWSFDATADRYWCIDDFRLLDKFLNVSDIKNQTSSSVSPYRNKVVSIATTVTKLHPFTGNIFTQDTSTLWSGLPIAVATGESAWNDLAVGDSIIVTALIVDKSSIPQLSEPSIAKVGTSTVSFIPYETTIDAIMDDKLPFSGLYVKINNLTLDGWDTDWFFSYLGVSVIIKADDTGYIFQSGKSYNIAGIYYEMNNQIYLIPLSDNDITELGSVTTQSELGSLSPNPFSTYLNLQLTNPALVKVYDLCGRSVMVNQHMDAGKVSIDSRGWMPGSYLIEILDNSGSKQMIKAIKTK